MIIKRNVEANFLKFKKDINPNLLFESLEALIVLMGTSKDKSDDFIDYLSQVYRYILSKKKIKSLLVSSKKPRFLSTSLNFLIICRIEMLG